MLLTAVIAAAACSFQHAEAETLVDYSVYADSDINIQQWKGGAHSDANKKYSVCYGLWYSAEYDNATQSLQKGNSVGSAGSSGGYESYIQGSQYLMLDADSSNYSGRAYFDATMTIAGIIVTENSAVSTVSGNLNVTNINESINSNRSITLGKAGTTAESPTYTVIASDFKLSNADSQQTNNTKFTLQGHQQWEVASGKKFTLQTIAGNAITNTGTLTIKGDGTVEFLNTLNNSGTLTVNGALKINKAITNSGTISTSETGAIVIDTAEFQNLGTIKGYSDSATGNGYATYDTITVVNNTGEGTISGSLNVNVGGTTYTTNTGVLSNITDKSLYWVNTATVDANEINASRYALNGGKLAITEGKVIISKISDLTADSTGSSIELDSDSSEAYLDFLLPSDTSKLSVTGDGKLSIGFTPTKGHGQTLNLGSGFNGTLSIREGFMMLDTFTVGTGATFELIGGEHWSSGTKTISNNIKLAATTEHGYVFRNQNTTTLTGQVTGTYLSVGKGYSDNGTLVLSNAANNIESVNVGNGRLKLTENAVFGKISTIGNANNRGLELGANVTMTLGNDTAATESSISLLVAGDNSKVQLGSKATLNAIGTINGTAALVGSGTYKLGNASAMTTGLSVQSTEWTGTVELNGSTLTDANLNDYGNAGSTVKLYGANGTFADNSIINTNIQLANNTDDRPGFKVTATSDKTVTFAGKITGENFVVEPASGKATGVDTYKFTGDVSTWEGNFISTTDVNLVYEGNATNIANGIAANAGTLNVTYGGTAATTVSGEVSQDMFGDWSNGTLRLNVTNTAGVNFTNTVVAESTSLANGATAKFDGASNLGALTLGSGASISGSGNLTIGALSLDLQTYTTDYTQKTLVSTTGTLTFTGDLTAYESVTVGQYIATVSRTDNSLILSFSEIPTVQSLEVSSAVLADGVLTLTLGTDATLTAGANVDLTLSADALASIQGVSGLVDLELVAGNGTFSSVLGSEDFVNVSFYGTYAGEANGQYRVEYIPEPTTATLSLLALCGLAARRRRR